jgi:hypothetical protein
VVPPKKKLSAAFMLKRHSDAKIHHLRGEEDINQAVELSMGCPIFEVDGEVEVRPVMKMNI